MPSTKLPENSIIEKSLKLIVGLGNPGPQYETTRHNAGFLLVDYLADIFNFSNFKSKFKSEYAEGSINGQKVMLIKPMTFMNLSGNAVGEFVRFYKIPSENVFVAHDELDIPVGKVKLKFGGGSAGHNGLKSITSHISANFHRIRLGISHPGHRDDVSDYVLSNYKKDELKQLEEQLIWVANNIDKILSGENQG